LFIDIYCLYQKQEDIHDWVGWKPEDSIATGVIQYSEHRARG